MNRCARALARARDRALDLVRALDLDYDRGRAHNLADDLALALDRAFVRAPLDHDLDLGHVRDRAHNLALALDYDRGRAHALALELGRPHNLDRAYALALAFDGAHDLTPSHAHDLDRAHALALDRALDHAHNCAFKLIRALDRAHDLHLAARQEAVTGAGSSMPGRVQRGVVALATRVLPVRLRPRYREEFRAELVELPHQERLGYALRVLARAWELRRDLTGAVRTPDGSPARRAEW